MERIRLSKTEKELLKRINLYGDECIVDFPSCEVSQCIHSLEAKGVVKGAYIEGGGVESVLITKEGKSYIRNNPNLTNPMDWSKVAAVAGIIAAIAAVAALFVSCLKYG